MSGLCSSSAPGKTIFYISKSILLFFLERATFDVLRGLPLVFGKIILYFGFGEAAFGVLGGLAPISRKIIFCSQGPVVVSIFVFLGVCLRSPGKSFSRFSVDSDLGRKWHFPSLLTLAPF